MGQKIHRSPPIPAKKFPSPFHHRWHRCQSTFNECVSPTTLKYWNVAWSFVVMGTAVESWWDSLLVLEVQQWQHYGKCLVISVGMLHDSSIPRESCNVCFHLHGTPATATSIPFGVAQSAVPFMQNLWDYRHSHGCVQLTVCDCGCQVCERRFTQLSHLQQHIRTHTGAKPYTCQHAGCSKAFSQLSNLQSHMRSHMTDRPFRCFSCYKCFSDEATLRDHIPKHVETKHLKTKICPVCGKSYAQENYLARHMLRHQISPTDGASRPAHPSLPPISLPVSQPPTNVPTAPVFQVSSSVGSCYPQLLSGVFQQSGTESVGFNSHFLRNLYSSSNQLN